MLRGSCVLALLIAIGCGDHLSTTESPAVIGGELAITPSTIEIVGPPGVLSTATYTIDGTDPSTHLTQLQWNGDVTSSFSSLTPTCPAGICPYGSPGLLLDINGTLQCTPSMMAARTATLTATSNTGAEFTATVNCRVTAGVASFTVPPSVGRVAAAVGEMAPATLVVTNTGNAALMIEVEPDTTPTGAQWTVLECVAAPCPLPVGQTLEIDLEFRPTEHGDVDATVAITGSPAGGNPTVMLLGTGVGAKLRVDDPPAPAFRHDFGTIAKNQLVTFQTRMSNIGNAPLEVTPDDPGAPFSVATAPVTIADGGQGMFAVSCMSATATAQQTRTINLTEDAYDQNTETIEVACAVANTTVQVTNPLDFGELRVGDPAGMLTVEIDNPPGGGAVTIDRIELVGAPAALALVAPSLPMSLADGGQLTAMLELETTADLVLEDVTLHVELTETDPVTLELPVSGRVGTPAAVVVPTTIDLGTVCVGTPVEGSFTMTNTGTASLRLQRPTMDSEMFVPLYTNPTDYPAEGAVLVPGDKATVGVMPATTMAGMQTGKVTWDVDAPNAPFETTVTLGLLMEGTAVSPGTLFFNVTDIAGPAAPQQMITIENCGPDAAIVGYGGVAAQRGTAGAWIVDPPTQQRELLPDETMRVRVAFRPTVPGRHEARLAIAVDDSERIVVLDADATGTLPDPTSFYSCGCGGAADPERGWPIVAALLLVWRRRRR